MITNNQKQCHENRFSKVQLQFTSGAGLTSEKWCQVVAHHIILGDLC